MLGNTIINFDLEHYRVLDVSNSGGKGLCQKGNLRSFQLIHLQGRGGINVLIRIENNNELVSSQKIADGI